MTKKEKEEALAEFSCAKILLREKVEVLVRAVSLGHYDCAMRLAIRLHCYLDFMQKRPVEVERKTINCYECGRADGFNDLLH